MSAITPGVVELCLLRLCGKVLTDSQVSKLRGLGLLDDHGPILSPLGFVTAYNQLAEIRFGGSNQARAVIADAARKEAESWQAEIAVRDKMRGNS